MLPEIEPQQAEFRDWPQKARDTLRDLEISEKVRLTHYGHTYVHPYVSAEYPDSMVHLAVLIPAQEFATWRGEDSAIVGELRAGLRRFYDKELGTLRRYLPNVGDDKDANEVDSWYLYHPLCNVARLAAWGDKKAERLFFECLDFAIKVARRFRYNWPVTFDITTLEVKVRERKEGDPGQTDVGGLYAYLMLQAFHLRREKRFLEEAKKAIQAQRGLQFELNYQTNITAWGFQACLRLWKETGDAFYREQAHLVLASFFHNTLFWESEIENARSYRNFLGATCLHNGPYMAIYECFESFAAFFDCIDLCEEALDPEAHLLILEYCRHALDRAWFFYPSELPKEALADKIRNGEIDRALAFPLEDLYGDGQPAGQVGQEVYGCGAAFTFTTRAFHRIEDLGIQLYCEYPLRDLAVTDDEISFRVIGQPGRKVRLRVIPLPRRRLGAVRLRCGEQAVTGGASPDGWRDYTIAAAESYTLHHKPARVQR